MDAAPTRYGASRDDVATLLAAWGEPAYRARQVWSGLWEARRPLSELTSLPRGVRERLEEALPLALDPIVEQSADRGTTRKCLWRARDGAEIETVLMRSPTRATVCVSSQAGCAMGCTFCATGQAGFRRHLASDEIVEQVVRAAHASPERVGNVVLMGMGEPLANLDNVLPAIARLHDELGISARHVTVSTVGIVPGIRRLADWPLPVTLAVSLHAADDVRRERLVPLNRRYPVAEVVAAAHEYASRKGRRVTFEYACIADVNDRPADAAMLVRLLRGFRAGGGAHVNLIPLNGTAGFTGDAPSRERLAAFARTLNDAGIAATIRRNRGTDIDAACGQLRARSTGDGAPRGASATMVP